MKLFVIVDANGVPARGPRRVRAYTKIGSARAMLRDMPEGARIVVYEPVADEVSQ